MWQREVQCGQEALVLMYRSTTAISFKPVSCEIRLPLQMQKSALQESIQMPERT